MTELARPQTTTDEVDQLVMCLFAMIADRLEMATAAFLALDQQQATRLIAGDGEFQTLQEEVEELVEAELGLRYSETDIAFLLAVLRIVPELERSGDLVEHIALRTAEGVVSELTAESRALVSSMAAVGARMWRRAARAYIERDAAAAEELRLDDDELDDLHVCLTTELAGGSMPLAAAIEMGLIARFYERLGDHAVNVTRRMPASVTRRAS
jgi:phosphate transport system protein